MVWSSFWTTSTPDFPSSSVKNEATSSVVAEPRSNAIVRDDWLCPGICMSMRSGGLPSTCTTGSLTPNSLTLRSTMLRTVSTSSADGASPSSVMMS